MKTKQLLASGAIALVMAAGCSPRYDLKLDTPKDGQGKVTFMDQKEVDAALFNDSKDKQELRFGKFMMKRMDVDGTPFVVGYDDYEKFAKVEKGDLVYFSTYGKGVLVPNELGAYDKYRMVHVTVLKKGRQTFTLDMKDLKGKGVVEGKKVEK